LIGRIAGKYAVSSYLAEPDLCKIHIDFGVFGQPIVKHSAIDKPDISLTHSDDMAIALAYPEGHQIGIDLEKMSNDNTKIDAISSQLTSSELMLINKNNLADYKIFIIVWTMKEALSKVLKCGLTTPFKIFELSELISNNGYFISSFKFFEQYKSYSYIINSDFAFSIVLPKYTAIDNEVIPLFFK